MVRPADIDETPLPHEPPRDYVIRIACEKAVAADGPPSEIVLGADTTVVAGDAMLAKPSDAEDASRMLEILSGKRHEVLTGICLKSGLQIIRECVETSVWFAPLSRQEIADYVASGEPLDKAGGYAIQGRASKFIHRVEGCYFNVVGLPIATVYRCLRQLRYGTLG